MDVTCERCHTEYEFDDALVSEQGTSVRCTQCGHKFRVKKQGGMATPEIWVVRTIDGRELEFRAIRDLKTAISGGRISRDDVLSRGVGRPRRLASIAELEPFFSGQAHLKTNTQIGLGDEPRARSVTPQGLGPPMINEDSNPGPDNSVAIPLPSPSQGEVTRQYPRELADDLSQLDDDARKVGTTTAVQGTASAALSSKSPSEKRPASEKRTPALGTPPVARTAPDRPNHPELAPMTDREPQSIEPDTARRMPSDPTGRPESVGATPRPAAGREPSRPEIASNQRGPGKGAASEKPPQVTPRPPSEARLEQPASQREAQLPPASEVEPSTLRREAAVATPAPAEAKLQSGDATTQAIAQTGAVTSEAPPDVRSPRESMDSIPPEPGVRRGSQTPTPTEVRYSISNEDSTINSDPRLSAVSSRGASSATRLIVGVLVAGAVAFVLVLLVQRFVMKPSAKTGGASDQRVATFVAEGEKSLAEGDLDAAKEELDKASALGDSDPRVAKDLARLANARTDIPWLRLRLLSMDDPERDTTKRDYADAADRSRKAVEKAQSLAPSDAEVVRAEVDQKRLAGDVSGARKLVDGMSSVSTQPESALVLGALDLAEESPPWTSVIDRLSKAAAQEGGLGRARALLVYTLAMSGDPKAARAELGRLAALPRPHPLTGALRKFLDRVDKGETPPLKVDDLPSLTSPSDGGVGSSDGVPGSTAAALKQALDARSHGDSHRAENLYQSVIDKDPNNSEALAGLASLARSQGGSGRAMGLYQRVIDHNPNYVPAIMSLADMKWDSGDRAAASALYARAVELGSSEARARERSTAAPVAQPEPQTSAASGGAMTADPAGGSTGEPSPPATSTPPPTPPDAPKEGTP